LASAQATAKRLQQQMAEDKQSVQAFSRNFMDYQAMQDELKSLEQLRQAARQKVVSMEASELARKPRTQVIENATMPDSAWRPLYWRDAGISMVGSLVLGFLAVWFVEFFNRRDPVSAATSSTVIIPQPWVTIAPPDGPALAAPTAPEALANQSPVALAAPPARELSADEQRSLLAEAAPEQIPLLVCLLCGLTAGEAAALRVADVETLSGRLTVGGDGTRVLDVGPALAAIVARYASDQLDTPLLRAPSGKQMTEADVRGVVMTAALDAGIAKAHEVTPSTLRHTYVAFIARQGLRFSDLGRLVGPTPAEDLNALAALAPGIRRVGLDQIEKILPAVRELATG
jgi:integrase